MIIHVKVKLYSREAKLEKVEDGEYLAYLTKIPDKGKANDELVGLLAREVGVSRGSVNIKTLTARKKIVEIDV
ncbi:MAG: DUF167 family protein [Nanoarchaeota archaeon]